MIAIAFHSPSKLWDDHEGEFQVRSDEEIAAEVMRGMSLWKKELAAQNCGKRRTVDG